MRQIEDFTRVPMAFLPTPLEQMKKFGQHLGINLWLKRDDYTGFGGGGNKARKMEFLIAEALEAKADVLITTGGHQSNHARMVAAVARHFDMESVLVLKGPVPETWQGNLLLNRLLQAKFDFIPHEDYFQVIDERIAAQAEQATARGKVPYIIPLGGATPLSTLGYANAVREMDQQFRDLGVKPPDYIVTAVGSGGTQAGLEVGVRRWWPDTRVIGISVSREKEFFFDCISRIASAGAELLEWPYKITDKDLLVEDGFVGPGYGMPSEGGVAAIMQLAKMESVFLDPVYTGKAMDGLINLVQRGAIEQGKSVLFLHTGGQPSIFAFADALAAKAD